MSFLGTVTFCPKRLMAWGIQCGECLARASHRRTQLTWSPTAAAGLLRLLPQAIKRQGQWLVSQPAPENRKCNLSQMCLVNWGRASWVMNTRSRIRRCCIYFSEQNRLLSRHERKNQSILPLLSSSPSMSISFIVQNRLAKIG